MVENIGNFLNWFIKHYSTKKDKEGFEYYADANGKEVSIDKIIKHYSKEEELNKSEFYLPFNHFDELESKYSTLSVGLDAINVGILEVLNKNNIPVKLIGKNFLVDTRQIPKEFDIEKELLFRIEHRAVLFKTLGIISNENK